MSKFGVDNIQDPVVRENFQRIFDFLNSSPLLKGDWRFVEISLPGASTNYKFKHGLTFVPKDIHPMHISGPGSVTWNYSLFDRTNLDITVTDECVIRALVGRYSEG